MNLPRTLALCALATLIVGAILLITGVDESGQRAVEKQNGLTKIPHDSELVRSLLDAPLEDDEDAVDRTSWLLAAADRSNEAVSLNRFVVDCNVRRFVGEDDACHRETVSSAITKGAALTGQPGARAAPPNVEARLAQTLSLSWPGEALLRATVDPRNLQRFRFDGAGVLRYVEPPEANVVIAVRNQGPWEVAAWGVRIALSRAGGAPIKFQCDSDRVLPLYRGGSLAVGAQAVAQCYVLSRESQEQATAALLENAAGAGPQAYFGEMTLRNPSVRVTDEGPAASPRFKVEPMGQRPVGGLRRSLADLPHELAAMDCNNIAHCPSAFADIAIRFNIFRNAIHGEIKMPQHLIFWPCAGHFNMIGFAMQRYIKFCWRFFYAVVPS